MRIHVLAISALISSALVGSASAATYTSSATFLPNVAPGAFFNNFGTVAGGSSSALSFSGGGYSYTVDSAPTSNDLFNDPGVISTNLAAESILITFTGAPVTAVGGNMWSTDINVLPIGSTMTLTLSNGVVETYASSAATDYRGFTSLVPITSISIDAGNTSTGGPAWPTLDNLTVGAAVVPEPAALSLFAVGASLLRRRRA